MLTRDTIKNVFGVESPEQDVMTRAIELWAQMYSNQSPWLKENEIYSLNLAAVIASEVARTVTIESSVDLGEGPRAAFLQPLMNQVMDEIREQAEYGIALGGMVFKPYIDRNNRIVIDYVKADSFYPMESNSNGTITAGIFVDKRQIRNKWYTRFEYHQMVENGCQITNIAYRSDSENTLGVQVPLTSVPEWAALLPQATITNITKPLFAYFRYPLANTIDSESRLGVSCYARAVDLIQQADRLWSNFLWEFESGQRALYVDVLAFGKDGDNKPVLPNKRLYRTLDAGGQEDALFKDWSPNFRQADLLAGLDAILKRIEFSVGLAYGTLSDPQEVARTATEIMSSRQRTYATVVDTQKALEDSLRDLIWAIDQWATIGNLAPSGVYDPDLATFYFDDSVIVDKDMQFQSDLRLVGAGIMSKWEFRVRNLGEEEAVAKEKIAAVTAETPPEPPYPMGV